MKVLFLIEGWISPAPRYRVLQFLPWLHDQGVEPQVRALHGHSYPFFYRWPVIGNIYKAIIRTRRLWHLRDAHRYDVIFQQRLTLPFTSLIERLLVKRNPRLIFDFDDALFQTEAGPHAGRMAVFRQVVALARCVIAGSDYLARHAREDAHVIPTIIDTDLYLPLEQPKPEGEPIVIGWMGTHSNYPNFELILPALRQVLETQPNVRLKLVSDSRPPFDLPKTEFVRWRSEREIEELQSFDIGIMPLIDHAWNRGKCAFKLIQYMSVGKPVVAGAVGANNEVVLHGETGFLARDAAGWRSGLTRLIEDASVRLRLGAAGRQRCVDHYSLIHCRQELLRIIREVANDG